ncbi:MAG: membrane protein insertion efficiency factor YidD [Gammaproteobacteria bacterium]
MQKLLTLPIRAYQYLLSPYFGHSCRYTPTCSQYAIEAIDRCGAIRGLYLAIKRLSSCHPWHVGGYDPVPGSKSVNTEPGSR